MPTRLPLIAMAALACLVAEPAYAYIGPGAGLSLIAAFWALVTAIVASLGFLLLWPFRHRLRRRKKTAGAAKRGSDGAVGRTEPAPLRSEISERSQ